MILQGRSIYRGLTVGEALVTGMGISFFGGVDPDTGVVIERGHELEGQSIVGKILVFPSGKGSTVGSYTLYRLKRNGLAPAAVVNAECETITAVGCIIAEIPCVDHIRLEEIKPGMRLWVDGTAGTVEGLPAYAGALPACLGGWEEGSFARYTISTRLPQIARETLSALQELHGESLPETVSRSLQALVDDMPLVSVRYLEDHPSVDAGLWHAFITPFLGKTWLELPWFFAEMVFYRRLLEATGYYLPGWGQGRDPFTLQKQQGLQASFSLSQHLASLAAEAPPGAHPKTIQQLLRASLWGNQADLSMWAAGKGPAHENGANPGAQSHARLLVDDTQAAAAYLAGGLPRVDLVVDNTGSELQADLALVDYLLTSGCVRTIYLHVKAHPTFVSDAMRGDIPLGVDFLCQSASSLVRDTGERLSARLQDGSLFVREHFFWHSPYPAWEMPGGLSQELAKADLLIFKGDANYRRLLGDLHWEAATPFSQIVHYRPAPILALRVCKSEVICGLKPGQPDELFAQDPQWMVDGHWGVAQFAGN